MRFNARLRSPAGSDERDLTESFSMADSELRSNRASNMSQSSSRPLYRTEAWGKRSASISAITRARS